MNEKEKKIKDQITNIIHSGKVFMKPKWYFVLKTILRVLFIVILFFVLIYLLNFIGFVTHENGFNLLALKPREMRAFMGAVPWIVVLLSMVLLLVFYILVKRYSFIYRKPMMYSFFGLVFFVVFIGFLVHLFDVKFKFARFGEGPRTPILGPMHEYYRKDMKRQKRFDRMQNRMPIPNNMPDGF